MAADWQSEQAGVKEWDYCADYKCECEYQKSNLGPKQVARAFGLEYASTKIPIREGEMEDLK